MKYGFETLLTAAGRRIVAPLLIGAMPVVALAQDYPSGQVTMVVPFGPGGGNDTMGRFLAEQLSDHWSQNVIVENKPGAGSAIGSAYVAGEDPDGETLLFVSTSYTTNAATISNLPFDPYEDLQPVAFVGTADLFLLTGSRVELPTVGDLKTEAENQTIFAATSGVGSMAHLAALMMSETLDVDFEYVHQSGGSGAMTDLGGGRVDTFYGVVFEATSGIGQPTAVLSAERSPFLPEVPTTAEAGYPEALVNYWFAIFVPKGTPEDIVTKLNQDIVEVMQSDAASEFLTAQGVSPSSLSVTEVNDIVQSDLVQWADLAERNGLRQ